MSARYFYTTLALKLASYGYLVILLDHQDGSCFFTESSDGATMKYKHQNFHIYDLRRDQLKIRVDEVKQTIYALKSMPKALREDMFGAGDHEL